MRSDNSCTGGGISHAAKALSGVNAAADTRERERESKSVAGDSFITSIALSYHHYPPLKRRGGELSTSTKIRPAAIQFWIPPRKIRKNGKRRGGGRGGGGVRRRGHPRPGES